MIVDNIAPANAAPPCVAPGQLVWVKVRGGDPRPGVVVNCQFNMQNRGWNYDVRLSPYETEVNVPTCDLLINTTTAPVNLQLRRGRRVQVRMPRSDETVQAVITDWRPLRRATGVFGLYTARLADGSFRDLDRHEFIVVDRRHAATESEPATPHP